MEDNNDLIEKIVNNLEKVIIGKKKEIYNVMKGILANGHVLIEDVPGVGKTTLVKTLAKSFSLTFNRIQFTPDVLPSDITGISIYNQKNMEFEFRKGPIFANLILADEINRTSPKSQSALLEVMEEKQVSEGGNTYKLDLPFFVIATQNPIEHEGTYILPEAQLDRFMIRVKLGYPKKEDEVNILEIYRNQEPLDNLESVATASELLDLQKKVRQVYSSKEMNEYIVEIVNATRINKRLLLGASPRAALALLRVAQANAVINKRDYIIPEDVKENAALVLAHRVTLSSFEKANENTSDEIIEDIINNLKVPRVR
ncbi:MAG TPA: MoxR family ATPase [Clostridiaceae bacterium]